MVDVLTVVLVQVAKAKLIVMNDFIGSLREIFKMCCDFCGGQQTIHTHGRDLFTYVRTIIEAEHNITSAVRNFTHVPCLKIYFEPTHAGKTHK